MTDAATKTAPEVDDEDRLVERAADGDRDAFRTLYDRYVDSVIRHVGRILGHDSDVEDVVQNVFVQVHRSLPGFQYKCSFSTWLYRVTYNVTVSHIRKKPSTVDLSDWRLLKCDTDQWGKLEARDLLRVLHAALDNASVDHREAFLLHEVEGMKLREIAELTGESINTIAARVRRTRIRLQKVLEANLPDVGER